MSDALSEMRDRAMSETTAHFDALTPKQKVMLMGAAPKLYYTLARVTEYDRAERRARR